MDTKVLIINYKGIPSDKTNGDKNHQSETSNPTLV